jgi:hypothetical protein
VWTQVPAIADGATGQTLALMLPDGLRAHVPRVVRRFARELAMMASFPPAALGNALAPLVAHGIVGPEDLPLVVVPEASKALDGWRFS